MLIYRLQETNLTPLGDHAEPRYESLLAQPAGEHTVGDLLALGHCAVVAGEWVVPEVVTVAGGNARADELDWVCEAQTSPRQVEYKIAASFIGGQTAKQSLHIQVVQGFEKIIPPHAQLITTTKGPLLTSDLIFREPQPGAHEYWYPTVDPPVSPLDRVETEVLSDGTKRYLELVHRSAVAQSA